MKRYSMYAYDPGDGLLSVSAEYDYKYGKYVLWKDVEPLLKELKEDWDRAIEQQTKISPFFSSYQKLKEILE